MTEKTKTDSTDVIDKLYDSREITITAFYLLKTILKHRQEKVQKLEVELEIINKKMYNDTDALARQLTNMTNTNIDLKVKIDEVHKILDEVEKMFPDICRFDNFDFQQLKMWYIKYFVKKKYPSKTFES